jgi:hypothetical protein
MGKLARRKLRDVKLKNPGLDVNNSFPLIERVVCDTA